MIFIDAGASPKSPASPRLISVRSEPQARQEHLEALEIAGAVVDRKPKPGSHLVTLPARDLHFESRALGYERGDSEPSHAPQPTWAL